MIPLNPSQLTAPQTSWLNHDQTPNPPFFNLVRSLFLRTGGASGIPLTVANNIAAIGVQGSTLLSNDLNAVTSGNGGVTLAALQPGQWQVVYNGTGGNLAVYPAVNGQIDASGVNAPSLVNMGSSQFYWGQAIMANGGTLYRPLLSVIGGGGGGGGGFVRPQRSITSSAGLPFVAADSILNINSANDLTPTVPLASGRAGAPFTFKNLVGSHSQTFTRTPPDTFDGQTTYLLAAGAVLTLMPYNDGVNSGYAIE